jgi:hypothetical protein
VKDGTGQEIPVRRLPDPKARRGKAQHAFGQAVAMAHNLVPRLESFSKVAG